MSFGGVKGFDPDFEGLDLDNMSLEDGLPDLEVTFGGLGSPRSLVSKNSFSNFFPDLDVLPDSEWPDTLTWQPDVEMQVEPRMCSLCDTRGTAFVGHIPLDKIGALRT